MNEVILLLVSGIVVGVINTLGGGGSVITMALFMAMGMPVAVANGTNRIAVVMQNLSATIAFMRKNMLDIKNSLRLGIPTILGTIAGSLFAIDVSEATFKICLSVVLAVILVYLILDRNKTPENKGHELKIRWWHYLLFFFVGFYGGYIYRPRLLDPRRYHLDNESRHRHGECIEGMCDIYIYALCACGIYVQWSGRLCRRSAPWRG